MNIAFFDIDGTLVKFDTGQLVLNNIGLPDEKSNRFFGAIRRIIGVFFYNKYINSIYAEINNETYNQVISELNGKSGREILESIRFEAKETIREYREKGYLICLISATDISIAKFVSGRLGLDACIASNNKGIAEKKDTAISASPYGIGKYVSANAFCKQLNTELKNCIFFSDSYTDMPLLLAVGQGVVVNPSFSKRIIAALLNFKVVRWN